VPRTHRRAGIHQARRAGKYREALESSRKKIRSGGLRRICPHACESECTRCGIDEPVAVDEIKKIIAEQDLNAANRFVPTIRHDYGKKIAVVGSGPAGLSCAYFLALDGYKVTVFENGTRSAECSRSDPGIQAGEKVINAEIDIFGTRGRVQDRRRRRKGRHARELRANGFKAFYLASARRRQEARHRG
jgi:NADPH-dependent glutamate synthase beta subunit-like oxidoreductase